jgi:hypothetical protein
MGPLAQRDSVRPGANIRGGRSLAFTMAGCDATCTKQSVLISRRPPRLWGRWATLLVAPMGVSGVSRSQQLLSASPYGRSCFDFVPERPQLGLPATSSTMPW